MSKKKLFVISDLHLGGAADTEEKLGFQMCSNQKSLAEFIEWVSGQAAAERNDDYHLILAGDVIDFLAEAQWAAFTADEDLALEKLEAVFGNFSMVFSALRKYVESGAKLIILLGNHDVEMCLPRVRRRLLDELGGGKIEFLYDNEALIIGDVIIEHGNRYDSWNAVDHDALRQIRSLLSRRQDLGEIVLETPGSVFVASMMNDLKERYKFIDLLKPENLAVALLLSTLKPSEVFSMDGAKTMLGGILKAVSLVKPTYYGQFANKSSEPGAMPARRGLVSGNANNRDSEKERFEDLLEEVGFDPESVNVLKRRGTVSGGGESWGDYAKNKVQLFVERLGFSFTSEEKDADAAERKKLERIFKAFKKLIETNEFDEKSVYTEAAGFLSQKFNVIVFGHTHKALRKELREGEKDSPVYLNSGTWADVILIPEHLLAKEAPCDEFKEFVENLTSNNLTKWRTSKGTFVEIDLDEQDRSTSANVYSFGGTAAPRNVI